MTEMDGMMILRLVVAGLLGGLIGFEREIRAKEAGVRTHFIVALGSALFMLISQFAFRGQFDASRVAAQVVSGIGFIGAGVIIFQKNAVRGVTTAAGLWVAAAVGLAAGAGMYPVAVAASLLTILCLEMMHLLTRRYGERALSVTLSPVDTGRFADLMDTLRKEGMTVHSFSFSEGTATLQLRVRQKDFDRAVRRILDLSEGVKVEILG